MDVFKVQAVIWNLHDLSRKTKVELLVDTGSTYTVLPHDLLKSLRVASIRTARLRLADNRVIEKPLGEIGIEIGGFRATATPVVSGDRGVYLLGSVTMEQLGLASDPIEKRPKPVEALLMRIRRRARA